MGHESIGPLYKGLVWFHQILLIVRFKGPIHKTFRQLTTQIAWVSFKLRRGVLIAGRLSHCQWWRHRMFLTFFDRPLKKAFTRMHERRRFWGYCPEKPLPDSRNCRSRVLFQGFDHRYLPD